MSDPDLPSDLSGVAGESIGSSAFPVAFTTKASELGQQLVCTLGADQVPTRIEDWMTLTGNEVVRITIPGGVRLELGDEVDLPSLARLAIAEHDCCRFFSFRLTIDQRGVGLEITAPDDALPVVHALVGVPA